MEVRAAADAYAARLAKQITIVGIVLQLMLVLTQRGAAWRVQIVSIAGGGADIRSCTTALSGAAQHEHHRAAAGAHVEQQRAGSALASGHTGAPLECLLLQIQPCSGPLLFPRVANKGVGVGAQQQSVRRQRREPLSVLGTEHAEAVPVFLSIERLAPPLPNGALDGADADKRIVKVSAQIFENAHLQLNHFGAAPLLPLDEAEGAEGDGDERLAADEGLVS